jgi:hypothetical protein
MTITEAYPPPRCYRCDKTGPDVVWREWCRSEAIPTCNAHKPLTIALRDFKEALHDFVKRVS